MNANVVTAEQTKPPISWHFTKAPAPEEQSKIGCGDGGRRAAIPRTVRGILWGKRSVAAAAISLHAYETVRSAGSQALTKWGNSTLPVTTCSRIAWHSPSHCEWTANQNRTAEKAFAANFDMKFSAQVFLSATYGHVEALQPKTVPRVRIPLPPPHSLKSREFRELFLGSLAKSAPIRGFHCLNRTAEKALAARLSRTPSIFL
jgi:hypothetical protein